MMSSEKSYKIKWSGIYRVTMQFPPHPKNVAECTHWDQYLWQIDLQAPMFYCPYVCSFPICWLDVMANKSEYIRYSSRVEFQCLWGLPCKTDRFRNTTAIPVLFIWFRVCRQVIDWWHNAPRRILTSRKSPEVDQRKKVAANVNSSLKSSLPN